MLFKFSTAAVAVLVAWCLMTSVVGQEKRATTDTNREKGATVNVEEKNTRVMLHRASEINGMKVLNSANKELGSIKDTVIDMRPGIVNYAVLSYGGFLGLGNKLFAVPWDALQHKHDVNNANPYFVLDIDEATLKNSPGFEDSHWPNFGDTQYTGKLDTYYDKFRKPHAKVSVNAPRADIKVDVAAKERSSADSTSERMMLRSSTIMGMKVKNEAQKELGTVADLVMEVHAGKIRYAALSYGGFLGLGDKLFAVPWKAFNFKHDISQKEFSLVLNMDEAHLRKATGFDKNKWPDFADPSITNELDKYYTLPGDTAVKSNEGAIIRERK